GWIRGTGCRGGRGGRRADEVRPRTHAEDTPAPLHAGRDRLLREVPLLRPPLRRALGGQRGRHQGFGLRPDPVERRRGRPQAPPGPDDPHHGAQDPTLRRHGRHPRRGPPPLHHPLRALRRRRLRRAQGAV
ncbi:MAG: Holo-[acyl-carrier-protein] synthase, partial [uncultured Rubrobacteraceae bacterium]